MYEDYFADHVGAVQRLADAGIAPPKAWSDLFRRYEQFAEMVPGGCTQRIVDAVLTGKGDDDLALQYMLAIAEADARPPAIAAVRNRIQSAVLEQLRTLYAAVATANYGKAAALFDASATTFTAAAATVDVEAAAEQVLLTDEDARQAWADATLAAQQLDDLMAVLVEAAELAGHHINNDGRFSLVVDDAGVPRRTAWDAWDNTTGRCGRWSALLAAGCQLRAHALDGFTPGTRPAPLEERWNAVGRGQFERTIVDPEEAGDYRNPVRTL